MDKKTLIISAVVLVLVVVGGYFLMNSKAGISTSEPNLNQPSSSVEPVGKTLTVDISASGFSPTSITVNKGDTVVWTNSEAKAHTVTSDKGNEVSSKLLKAGDSFSHTFTSSGTFAYHCEVNPALKATVMVQ